MSPRSGALLGLAALLGAASACGNDAAEAPAPPPPKPQPPLRGAAGDHDLRVLLAEIASARACEMIRGQFRPLRATERPDVSTGILWIRDCAITNDGTRLSLRLEGQGWQWAKKKQKKAGGTFEVEQYIKFDMATTIPGALDVAYDRSSHVLSLWFSPAHVPDVSFAPRGGVEVDEKGVWSSIIGTFGTVVTGRSPEDKAEHQAELEGKREFGRQLATGLAVTIDLCTGLSRFNLGRPKKGKMQPPDVGETRDVPVELSPGGLMVLGPFLAKDGMTAELQVQRGDVRASIACQADAEKIVAAFVDEREPPAVRLLATKDVGPGRSTLRVKSAKCPVSVIARPIGPTAVMSWRRPAGESARATGGPLIECPKKLARRP